MGFEIGGDDKGDGEVVEGRIILRTSGGVSRDDGDTRSQKRK